MTSRLCPTCGKPVKGGKPCPRCRALKPRANGGNGRSHGTRTREQERERKSRNPWRSNYSTKQYQDARQRALNVTNGCCLACHKRIADKIGGRWVMRYGAGGIHHIRALSEGGGNTAANLMPLCTPCHNYVDAHRRKRDARSD